MQASLQCFGVGLLLLSVAPSSLSFSRGASHASCREMIPGHIRAQPQDLQRSHVTLRTSASSYLPGQLVTVTVRSSRDFMGFLLQARRVEGPGLEVRPRSLGPVLVGGSWTLTPPGTHTLRCLSEGDTLTHSDKHLKRNLSFVWRAPDAPVGDIRFYITVVQSYFVYWAGIESAVVRDGSRSPWSWRNITGADGGNSAFALQEDEVTALPGPSPAPRRSIYNPLTSSSVLSKQLTLGQKLAIQNHILTSDPEPNLDLPTPGTVVHPNPDPHPNFDPNVKLNPGHKLKPNLPKTDTKPKRPSDPGKTPGKEGKLPDIIPRHSSWELGMLFGCSAGLGMVLVVGVRYMYRQACGKRTEVTLHDREREYARGERGLLHVQECGDLVRVRRIRENSFVLLAEYDILATPGD
ncbi:Reelin domain containing protein 1 [Dissostichus eleginoides]|uniref:Reelin domain containing protein 1 n=1 Tax=Dissostichus eleginoides TaxID=100907 RepID=A0AAD9BWL1_DISEL|nr:Reelin domain containing protein 1 [Dissostichus eleginoides]